MKIYNVVPDSIKVIPKEKEWLIRSQPRIKRIEIIDNDTLVLTEYFNFKPYRNTFIYSNEKFKKLMIDSCEVVDFFKYGKIALFVKRISDLEYQIISNTKNISLKLKSLPELVEVSNVPAIVTRNYIFLLDTISDKISKYKIPPIHKSKNNEHMYSGSSYKVYFNGHIFVAYLSEHCDGILLDIDLIKQACHEYQIVCLHSAIINDDTLIFLKGIVNPWVRSGMVKIIKNYRDELTVQEIEDKNYIFKGRNQIFPNNFLAVDKSTNKVLYLADFGFCLTKNDNVINLKAFDFTLELLNITYCDFPYCMYITGKRLFVGFYHSGIYLFDYPSLKFQKRIIFTFENLLSIGRLNVFPFLEEQFLFM